MTPRKDTQLGCLVLVRILSQGSPIASVDGGEGEPPCLQMNKGLNQNASLAANLTMEPSAATDLGTRMECAKSLLSKKKHIMN